MIARGFKPVAWVGAIGAAALSCYMLSLQVATERADLASLERRIVSTQQEIRTLQTELGTRGRMQQLEQWNAEVLALSAPVAGQFVPDHVSLAHFDTRAQPLDQVEVQMASAETPSAPQPALAAPVRQAALQQSPQAAPPLAPAPPLVRRAALTSAPQPAPARQAAVAANRPAEAPQRTQRPVRVAAATATPEPRPARSGAQRSAPAARGSSLLDAATLRELGTEARAERRGGTRN